MKKLLLVALGAVFLSVAFIGAANATPTLPQPLWKIKFENFEVFNDTLIPNDPRDPSLSGIGDGKEDNWGIATITSIRAGHEISSTTWTDTDDKWEIRAIFGGMDVIKWTGTGQYLEFETGAATTLQDGTTAVAPFIDFYLIDSTATDFKQWADVVAGGPGSRIGAYGFDGITNSPNIQLLAEFDLVSGIDSGNAAVITEGGTSSFTSNPPSGSGTGYADVDRSAGGLWANSIEEWWPVAFDDGKRDAKLVFDFDAISQHGWDLSSDDPFEGAAIPEPTTMVLFGFGLLGIAAAGRRRAA